MWGYFVGNKENHQDNLSRLHGFFYKGRYYHHGVAQPHSSETRTRKIASRGNGESGQYLSRKARSFEAPVVLPSCEGNDHLVEQTIFQNQSTNGLSPLSEQNQTTLKIQAVRQELQQLIHEETHEPSVNGSRYSLQIPVPSFQQRTPVEVGSQQGSDQPRK